MGQNVNRRGIQIEGIQLIYRLCKFFLSLKLFLNKMFKKNVDFLNKMISLCFDIFFLLYINSKDR